MQNVSTEYMESMKSPLRGRGFIEATLRLTDVNGEEILLKYDNKNIISSSYTNYMMPICIELPQDDFILKVNNQDRIFDIDNPESPINFMNRGNKLTVRYGYEISKGNVEWLPVRTLYLTDWKADNKTATFNAVDPLRLLTEPLPSERDIASQIPEQPLSQMLQWLLNGSKVNLQFEPETGEDPVVKPDFPGELPKKEAVQLLVNANSYDAQLVNGDTLLVRPAELKEVRNIPPVSLVNADPVSTSARGIAMPGKVKYASLAKGYTRVDGSHLIKPGNNLFRKNAGLVPNANTSPFGIEWGSQTGANLYKASGVFVRFNSDTIPTSYRVTTMKSEGTTGEYVGSVTGNSVNVLFPKDFYNYIKIEFNAMTDEQRCSVSESHLISREHMEIEKGEMMSYPVAKKEEIVRSVTVEYYDYEFVWENFVKKNIEAVQTGEKFKITYDARPYHKVRIHTGKSADPYYIAGESKTAYGEEILCTVGSYRVTKLTDSAVEMFTMQPIGIEFIMDGYRRETFRYEVNRVINPEGTKDIVWKNPMITSVEQANNVLELLSRYYKDNVYYEYPTRGNPEAEAGDVIAQANDYFSNFEVQLVDHTVDFDKTFKGNVRTKRIGGED